MNISIPLFSLADRFTLKGVGSSARLLSFPIPESYSCTSRIGEGQVTKQLTKITAKMQNKPNLNN
jgi:hypothetical protein